MPAAVTWFWRNLPVGLHCRAAYHRLTLTAVATAIWNPLQSGSALRLRRLSYRAGWLRNVCERPCANQPGREGGSRHNPNQMSHGVLPLAVGAASLYNVRQRDCVTSGTACHATFCRPSSLISLPPALPGNVFAALPNRLLQS